MKARKFLSLICILSTFVSKAAKETKRGFCELYIKRKFYFLIVLFYLGYMTGCTSPAQPTSTPVQHADPFYNIDPNEYPLLHLPLIKPVEADSEDGHSPWSVFIPFGLWVRLPNKPGNSYYLYSIGELEKFSVKNGVIIAYSPYVDKNADPYIQDNYYHWFVLIPDKKIAEGFHTEDAFLQYIRTLGIQEPDWQTPDEAYKQFSQTGCLEWIPDCNPR